MDKKKTMWILLDLIFLVVFNAVFFIAGGANGPASTWISYAFIHLAYLMLLVSPYLIRQSSSRAVFGFSIYSISSTHFLIQLVVGVIIILTRAESYKLPLIIHIIIAGVYVAYLLSHLLANESTADAVAVHEAEVSYIKNAATKVKLLENKISDKQAKKEIERLYDLLHSSPSKTNRAVKSIESEIKSRISDLSDSVAAQSPESASRTAREICSLVEERNETLRTMN